MVTSAIGKEKGQGMTGSTVIASMRYRDAPGAIAWLCEVLGFERHLVVEAEDGSITHAQLTHGTGMIMLGSQRDDGPAVSAMGIYIVVSDIDAAHERARARGGEIVMEPEEQHYGGSLFGVRDPEGRDWYVGSYDPWPGDH